MSFLLNVYTGTKSTLTSESLVRKLRALPNFVIQEGGDLVYENENTGVYFVFGKEPVETPVKGYHSLDWAFVINYIRPAFFGLEIFPLIEKICSDNELLLDSEQEGKPKKYTKDHLLKVWLESNDAGLRNPQIKNSHSVAHASRKALTELWEFNSKLKDLELELLKKHLDVYVARVFYFRDVKDSKLVTAAAWTDCIPMILPPHTDYVIMMQTRKGLFKSGHDFKGFVSVKRLQREFPELFKPRADGSLATNNAFANKNSKALLALTPDMPEGTDSVVPVPLDRVNDAGA